MPSIEPYFVDIPFNRQDDTGVEVVPVAMYLPHELFAIFFAEQNEHWAQLFGSDSDRVEFLDGIWHFGYNEVIPNVVITMF